MSSSGSVHVSRQRLEGGPCPSRSLSPHFFLGGVAVRPDKARGKQHCPRSQESALDPGKREVFLGENPKEAKSREVLLAAGKV